MNALFRPSHDGRPPGLTLVELLVATLILSAAGAAMATVVRDASAASRRADRLRRALSTYDEWRIACAPTGADARTFSPDGSWERQDARGDLWCVRVTLEEPKDTPHVATASRIVWGRVTVSLAGARAPVDNNEPVLTIHRAWRVREDQQERRR